MTKNQELLYIDFSVIMNHQFVILTMEIMIIGPRRFNDGEKNYGNRKKKMETIKTTNPEVRLICLAYYFSVHINIPQKTYNNYSSCFLGQLQHRKRSKDRILHIIIINLKER